MKKILLFITTALVLLLFSSPALAEVGDIVIKQPEKNAGVRVDGLSGAQLLGVIIKNFILLTYTIAAVGVLIMFLWGALEWIFSGGDKEKLAAARKRIVSALIGLVILALTFVILGVVSQLTGIDILLDLTIPNLGTR